jgi:SAM-dependent methyltransferase
MYCVSPDSVRRLSPAFFLCLLLCVLSLLPFTARSADSEQPTLSLDVPFVPTPPQVVDKMLQMADVKSSDFLIDLGAGDGRIAVAAVRDYGAKGSFGVDLNPERVKEARANAEQAGVADRVTFEVQDLFETDFSRATVVSMYLLPSVNLKLRPKVLELAPGTRIVSHAFSMDDWEPDSHQHVDGRSVYFWVVPARIDGQWQLTGPEGEFAIDLDQKFQKITGTATDSGSKSLPITGALRGEVVYLDIDNGGATPQRYIGRVKGDSIVGLDDGGAVQGWRASRR